ncbi:MAG: 6-phosphofructokinase [Anaerolineales bacterium]|nr:6-phosphofructokinase [Anaerolineales bacterium]
MPNRIRTIGVMTSGGDSPGMNPCVRAVVREALYHDLDVYGIREGYAGMIRGEMQLMKARDVSGIIQQGGTILRTARSMEFKTPKGQREAIRQLNEYGIDAVVVIGGDGSLTGALKLKEQGVKVLGIPGSIDNDIAHTSMSIGVDTAMNTIIEAIDKLRDTASSHQRAFIIETMGRSCGYLAITSSIISGAELAIVPEHEVSIDEVKREVEEAYLRGKAHCIIVVAEGANIKAQQIKEELDASDIGFKSRVTILGHIQRGGSPSAFDRLLATRMGIKAVQALIKGEDGVMVGLQGQEMVTVPMESVIGTERKVNPEYFEMARILAL